MGNSTSELLLDYLRGIFDDVQDDEKMMQEYHCALFKDMHRQGRMYITNKRIYFYANIFGHKTRVAIPFEEVDKIRRKYGVGVIPNAIQIITTNGKKYFFTSFLSRENAYVMLNIVWKGANRESRVY